MPPTKLLVSLLAVVLAVSNLTAQSEPDPRRSENDKAIVKTLMSFARRAESFKSHGRARKVYRLVIEHYDEDQSAARRALGFRKVRGKWEQVKSEDELPEEDLQQRHERTLDKLWPKVEKKIVGLHRDYGVALMAEGQTERARYQLERALTFDPEDKRAHEALGHKKLGSFWGNEQQIEFVENMQALNEHANECAQLDFDVEMLDAAKMPGVLGPAGLPFEGARSKNFECWVVGDQKAAANRCVWAERALVMLERLCGDRIDKRKAIRYGSVKWAAVVRTAEQRDVLLSKCPQTRGRETFDRARLFGGGAFSTGRGTAVWELHYSAETGGDSAIGMVTKRYFANSFNNAFSEGMVHLMTYLLHDTVYASYMRLPHTVSADKEEWIRTPEAWWEGLQWQIERDKDWPLVRAPRERMDNFRDACRVKVWSFVNWTIGRYPDKWYAFFSGLTDKVISEEDVKKHFADVLGRPVAEIEAEWREWARQGSPIGRATER